MPRTPKRLLARRGVLVLIPRGPLTPTRPERVKVVGESRVEVRLRSAPSQPAWQSEDLRPVAYPAPWYAAEEAGWGPESDKQILDEHNVSLQVATEVVAKLRLAPGAYEGVRAQLYPLWVLISLRSRGWTRRDGDAYTDIDRVLTAVLAVYDVAALVRLPGRDDSTAPVATIPGPNNALISELKRQGPELQRLVRQCLESADVSPDFRTEIVAFGLLLHPDGIAWVPLPYALGPRGDRTALERPLEFALAVRDTTYRAAAAMHRQWRRALGYVRTAAKPGPKPGSKRAIPELESRLIAHLGELRSRGMLHKEIARDREAQLLYQDFRDDPAIPLTAERVGYLLRKHSDPGTSA